MVGFLLVYVFKRGFCSNLNCFTIAEISQICKFTTDIESFFLVFL